MGAEFLRDLVLSNFQGLILWQRVGTVTASHKMISACKHCRVLSMGVPQSEAAWAEKRLLRDLLRPHPFTPYGLS